MSFGMKQAAFLHPTFPNLVLFFYLALSAMPNATDPAFIQEIVQDATAQNYINYATLSVLIYDMGNPLSLPFVTCLRRLSSYLI